MMVLVIAYKVGHCKLTISSPRTIPGSSLEKALRKIEELIASKKLPVPHASTLSRARIRLDILLS